MPARKQSNNQYEEHCAEMQIERLNWKKISDETVNVVRRKTRNIMSTPRGTISLSAQEAQQAQPAASPTTHNSAMLPRFSQALSPATVTLPPHQHSCAMAVSAHCFSKAGSLAVVARRPGWNSRSVRGHRAILHHCHCHQFHRRCCRDVRGLRASLHHCHCQCQRSFKALFAWAPKISCNISHFKLAGSPVIIALTPLTFFFSSFGSFVSLKRVTSNPS